VDGAGITSSAASRIMAAVMAADGVAARNSKASHSRARRNLFRSSSSAAAVAEVGVVAAAS
jgi:5'-3' exonuclease